MTAKGFVFYHGVLGFLRSKSIWMEGLHHLFCLNYAFGKKREINTCSTSLNTKASSETTKIITAMCLPFLDNDQLNLYRESSKEYSANDGNKH